MKSPRINLERFPLPFLIVGLLGTIVCFALMISTGPQQAEMMRSYLFGYVFWLTLTLGCFGFTVLYHLLRAKWVLPVLRILETGGGATMIVVFGVLLLPIVIPVLQGNPVLYEWASPANRNADLVLKHREVYLNQSAFGIRFLIYFITWAGLAYWFKRSTAKQEKSGDEREAVKRNNLSGPAFIWFVITITFALTDWVMTLDLHWYSTMYGLWTVVSMGVGGFAFAVMIFCWNASKSPYKDVITEKLTLDMGNILFVLTMLWAYTSLSQYLILWSGNLPATNSYYVERSKFSWNVIGLVTVVGQFFLPFVMLLTPRNKTIPMNLAKVCLLMLVIHVLDVYQYVLPAVRQAGPMPRPLDILAFLSVGFLWIGITGKLLQREQLIPTFDNRLLQGGHGAH